MILETKTELKDRGSKYRSLWLGEVGDDGNVRTPAIGLEEITDADELFWFSYGRLRDSAVLIHDGYSLPQIFDDFDPALMGGRANVAIIYPIGNTTVAVALEQNVKLMKEDGVNVVLTAFPRLENTNGDKRIVLPFAYFFMDDKSYLTALEKTGRSTTALPIEFARSEKGVLVAVRFSKPITAHALWFHFTHYLRPVIHQAGVPLIQPLIWEAATYLKCALPDMLKGSTVKCPAQVNWFKKDTENMSRQVAMKKIKEKMIKLAGNHDALVVKAEKESGGRRAIILSTFNENDDFIDKHLDQLVEAVYDISRTDNVVVQEVVPTQVRRLYTKEFLETVTDRFIQELGLAVTETTPLFNYFRTIVTRRTDGEYDITHRIMVISTAGIANVGQGGRLFEYRDEKIDQRYRTELWQGIKDASLKSLAAQQEYMRTHREQIIDSYLEIHQEFADARNELLPPYKDSLGCPDWEIKYEMGDYMPLFLLDEEDRIEKVYDSQSSQVIDVYDRNGQPNPDVRLYLDNQEIELINNRGVVKRIDYFDQQFKARGIEFIYRDGKRYKARALVVVKIEPNPGAGLWRPHNDRLRLVGRDGAGCYRLFRNLGEWGKKYRDSNKSHE